MLALILKSIWHEFPLIQWGFLISVDISAKLSGSNMGFYVFGSLINNIVKLLASFA